MILYPPMSASGAPEFDEAKWVGEITDQTIDSLKENETVSLHNAKTYKTARLLVRDENHVRGFIEVPIDNGTVNSHELYMKRSKLAPLKDVIVPRNSLSTLTFTVVLCTRERPELLREALTSVRNIDYSNFDVVVVDNAPVTDATRKLVEEEFPEFTYVVEPKKGLSNARNTGWRAAKGNYIAFTDDDVIVDSQWLSAFARAFAGNYEVQCVTGLVPSGELRTPTQAYFESRVSWGRNVNPRIFSMKRPPWNIPAFPFAVAHYGTGANFAMSRHAFKSVGGFDPAFGAGSKTGGGEDIDMFTRVLFKRGSLVVQPDAVVWHRHRSDVEALTEQAAAYGIGLGAWLTKIMLRPRTALLFLRRAAASARQYRNLGDTNTKNDAENLISEELRQTTARLEKRSIVQGPMRYIQQIALNTERRFMPEAIQRTLNRFPLLRVAGWLSVLVAAVYAVPLVFTSVTLPPALAAIALAIFLPIAPGAAVFYRSKQTRSVKMVLALVTGPVIVFFGTTFMAMLSFWEPTVFLYALLAVTWLSSITATVVETIVNRVRRK